MPGEGSQSLNEMRMRMRVLMWPNGRVQNIHVFKLGDGTGLVIIPMSFEIRL
jgi:hypothetical protein